MQNPKLAISSRSSLLTTRHPEFDVEGIAHMCRSRREVDKLLTARPRAQEYILILSPALLTHQCILQTASEQQARRGYGRSGTTISPLCSMALVHAMYTRADGWGVFCVGAHHVVDHVVGAAKRGRVVHPPILIRRGDGAAISAEEPSNSRELKMRKCCSSTWHKPNGLRGNAKGIPRTPILGVGSSKRLKHGLEFRFPSGIDRVPSTDKREN